ncbi:MAG: isocitrate lyase/PEP mutase family protein [Burkholderiales bacterium]|nr:isocitrate lyase/PEP mutase family protein [Burkholderiales bacterium]
MTHQGHSARTPAQRRSALRARLARRGHTVVAPGIYDGVSARLADRQGFDALYMTGYGVVASLLGLPDAGIATYGDMVNRVAQLATVTDTPLICDADTGYGGLLNVMHTVRGYEAAGAAALQLEDQEAPKKCGHMLGRRVIEAADMAAKVRVAVETRNDPDLLVIARTDARTSLGLDEAMRRAERYARAGADVLFVEGTESAEEIRTLCRHFDLPMVVNLVEGGRGPMLTLDELRELGVGLALQPVAALLAAAQAAESIYEGIRATGSSHTLPTPRYDFGSFSQRMGFDWVGEFDARHARLMKDDTDGGA